MLEEETKSQSGKITKLEDHVTKLEDENQAKL